ncbi:MAG: GIY-YIG nuclease family protein, partial [Chloroflexota bacterium]|nr:GIY-YIG nuclease family protein [Chloroflexota bacterium]
MLEGSGRERSDFIGVILSEVEGSLEDGPQTTESRQRPARSCHLVQAEARPVPNRNKLYADGIVPSVHGMRDVLNTSWYVYILSNVSCTLYIGITNDLERRVGEHRLKMHTGFSRE